MKKNMGIIIAVVAALCVLGCVAVGIFVVRNQIPRDMGAIDMLCSEALTLNGKAIKLPTTLNKLGKDYSFGEEKHSYTDKLAYDCIETSLLYKGNLVLNIKLYDTTLEKLNRDSEINEIIMNDNENAEAFMVNGIRIGTTKDEVMEKFREINLANRYNGLGDDHFTYSNSNDIFTRKVLSFDFEEEKVSSIQISNKEEVRIEKGFVDEFSKKISINGRLIELPFTLDELDGDIYLENLFGLYIEESIHTTQVYSKGNNEFNVRILPLADIKRDKDFKIFEVGCSNNPYYTGKCPIDIAGTHIGSTKDDVISIFGEPKFTVGKNETKFVYFNNDDYRSFSKIIEFDFKEDKVAAFKIVKYEDDSKSDYTTLFNLKSEDDKKEGNVVDTYKDKMNLMGKSISLPITLNTLGSDYTFDKQGIDSIDVQERPLVETSLLYKGKKIMKIKLAKTTTKEMNRDSDIIEFIMKQGDPSSEMFDLDGIKIGMSRKEINEKFGKPYKVYRENLTDVLIYDYFSYRNKTKYGQIRFGFEKDVLKLIDVSNYDYYTYSHYDTNIYEGKD